MPLLRAFFWLVFFRFLRLLLVVLFEYGTSDLANGCKTELTNVKTYVMQTTNAPEKDDKAKEQLLHEFDLHFAIEQTAAFRAAEKFANGRPSRLAVIAGEFVHIHADEFAR